MSSTSVPPTDDHAPDGAGPAVTTPLDPTPDGAVVSSAPQTPAATAGAWAEPAESAGTGAAVGTAAAEETAAEPATAPATEERRVADVVDPATVRRAPRFGRFILLGVLLGAALAAVLGLATPASELERSDLLWFLLLALVPVGALTGAVVALVLDRRSLRARSARGAGEGARS